MQEPIKFTDDELHQIKSVQDKYAQITATLGQLRIQKHLLESEINKQLSMYDITQTTERDFANSLTTKYGDGTINLDTGEFIPKKTE